MTKSIASNENVEKVVKPPHKPTAITSFQVIVRGMGAEKGFGQFAGEKALADSLRTSEQVSVS